MGRPSHGLSFVHFVSVSSEPWLIESKRAGLMQNKQGEESVSTYVIGQRPQKCNYDAAETDIKWTFLKWTQLIIPPQNWKVGPLFSTVPKFKHSVEVEVTVSVSPFLCFKMWRCGRLVDTAVTFVACANIWKGSQGYFVVIVWIAAILCSSSFSIFFIHALIDQHRHLATMPGAVGNPQSSKTLWNKKKDTKWIQENRELGNSSVSVDKWATWWTINSEGWDKKWTLQGA